MCDLRSKKKAAMVRQQNTPKPHPVYQHVFEFAKQDKSVTFQVRVRSPKTKKMLVVSCQTLKEALAEVRKICGAVVKKAALKMASNIRKKQRSKNFVPKSEWKHVAYHKCRAMWMVQAKAGGPSYHVDQKEAAKVAAKFLKVEVVTLKKKKKMAALPSRILVRTVFMTMHEIYHKEWPGDYEDVIDRAKKPPTALQIMRHEPGLIASFLIAKCYVDRDILEQQWKFFRIMWQIPTGQHCTAQQVYMILVATLKALNGKRWPTVWDNNVTLGVGYFQRLCFHCRKLHMLTTTEPADTKSRALTFCRTNLKYWLVPWNQDIDKRIQTNIEFGEKLLQLSVARSLKGWHQNVTDLQKAVCKPVAGLGRPSSYMYLWTMRGHCLFQKHAAGIARLRTHGCTVKQLIGAFPDSKKELLPLAAEPGDSLRMTMKRPLTPILEEIQYKHCVSELSLETCLYSHANIRKLVNKRGVQWLKDSVHEAKKRRREHKDSSGINIHPARIFKMWWLPARFSRCGVKRSDNLT